MKALLYVLADFVAFALTTIIGGLGLYHNIVGNLSLAFLACAGAALGGYACYKIGERLS